MKILRLDLLAFGPFANVSLALDEGRHGLHIIHGPNEAGKTSSLRALRQWLYGIPHHSKDDFLHLHKNLRVGGLLEGADGKRLEFVRRKGMSKTLRGPDDVEVIDPSRLAELLGGVDEATFRQRFGIDYEELRKGGEAVVRGGGDLGEILFAAGAGMVDLGPVQKRLDEEADALFKSRGSTPRINKAISELADARRAVKDAQLLTSEWDKHDKDLRTAEKRQTEIDEQLLERRAHQGRLERINKALPLIGRRGRLNSQLVDVADAPLLDDDFTGARREATTQLSGARQAEFDALTAIEKLRAAITGLNVPIGLLEHRSAITGLHTDLGSFQKAAQDRPGLVARLENVEQQAETILRDLGRETLLRQAEQLRLTSAQRQRIRSLAGDCKSRLDKQNSADLAVRKLRDEIHRVESRLAALPVTRDASELKRAIRRGQKQGDLDQQLAEARATLRRLEKQAEVGLHKLRLWSGVLEQLELLPVPEMETIDRFESQISDSATTANGINERIDALRQRAQKLDQSLEKLRLERDVPTEDDLARMRRRRNEGWRLARETWREGGAADDPATLAFIDEFAAGGDLARAFSASMEAADVLADRLRREADRVAEKAKLTADRQDLEHELREQKERFSQTQAALKDLQSQWREQWSVLNIDPLSPREMRPWLNQQRTLAQGAEALRGQRAIVVEAETRIQSLRDELIQLLKQLGQPPLKDEGNLAGILDFCETVAQGLESANSQRAAHEQNLQTLRDGVPEAERHAEQAKHELEQWRLEWARAVAALGLAPDAAPSEANSVIEAVDELFALLKEAGEIRSRITGIDGDAETFQQSVRQLLAQAGPDLAELPVGQAVADLYDRLQAASTANAKMDGWKEQIEIEESKRDRAHAKVNQLQATVAAMCRQAGCAAARDLPAAEQRSMQRREIERKLSSDNEQLRGLAAGGTLEALIAEAEQFDPDLLQADLQRLADEIARLDREKTEVAETVGSHRNDLRRMDGSGRAAEAQEQAEHLLARIRGDAEQYIRLRLASAVLRRSIEQFREASKGPILARASDLFAELTLGSFEGLRADYDDHGAAVLVGVRDGDKKTVGVDGMSDGTRDQLYLALRLVLLESCPRGREPLPFIVDDILIMFDDDRAVAALRALARLSETTQVIFFTHHEHLVRLAREHLDGDVLFTHQLENRVSALPQALSS